MRAREVALRRLTFQVVFRVPVLTVTACKKPVKSLQSSCMYTNSLRNKVAILPAVCFSTEKNYSYASNVKG
jgi:hypothetical protein